MLLKYLLRTTVAGGLVGATHGAVTVQRLHPAYEPEQKLIHVASHAQFGAMAGPWLPVLVPIWFVLDGSTNDTECPVAKGGAPLRKELFGALPDQKDVETVAEKP